MENNVYFINENEIEAGMTNALAFFDILLMCILFLFNIYLHIILQMILLISCILCMLHTTNARKLGDNTKRD